MANADLNQSPMHQIRRTVAIAEKLKDETAKFWKAMTNVAQAAETLSSNCHALQLQTVVRAESATNSRMEDAQPSQELEGQSMADRVKRELLPSPEGQAEVAKIDVAELPSKCPPHTWEDQGAINTGWSCDGFHQGRKCLSGITGFHQTQGMKCYQCKKCRHTICQRCFSPEGHEEDQKSHATLDEEFDKASPT